MPSIVLPALRVGTSDRVFVLTGAGVSAESGIRTFRDAGGLWEKYRFEEVASPEGYVGPERPDNGDAFDECRLGKAGEVLPTLFDPQGPTP